MANPKYILVAAVTIDGKIARHSGHFPDWTSPEDLEHLHSIEDMCDVMIVGNTTYETAKKPLSKRNCIVFTRSVDTTGKENNLCLYVNPKKVNLRKLIDDAGYKKICILGGTQVYDFFLKQKLIDEMYITIEPIIFGEGLNLFSTKIENQNFKLKSSKQLNKKGTLLQHYMK